MAKYVCTVCGYVHEGDAPPVVCPLCGVGADKFVLKDETPAPAQSLGYTQAPASVSGKLTWADEHKIGVAKGLDVEVVQGLKDHFMGECTEVGMYLAMARQADRQGHPEVAEAYKRIAFEEAEHASKFAELLGEVVTESTQKNLEMRVEAENGACMSKLNIAKRAKELGYDAIHDTVHEMCKDEARHGQIFEGLLGRYFK